MATFYPRLYSKESKCSKDIFDGVLKNPTFGFIGDFLNDVENKHGSDRSDNSM